MITAALGAFVDASARCEAASVGSESRVLAYARVGPDATIGDRCTVQEHAILAGKVILEEGVVVGPGAVLGAESGEILVHRFARIGANVTVLPGVVVGRRGVVQPGSVVTQNVPANAIVTGNPATIVAYVDADHADAVREIIVPAAIGGDVIATRVRGVTLHRLTTARDLRGSLVAAEFGDLPFAPQRIFTVYDVPSESVRGAHAHRVCSQFLVCLAGALSCLVDDGASRAEIRLASPEVGLHIPPMVYGTQWRYSRDAVLLVLASHSYDAADYIRDYEEFLAELERGA